MAEDDTPNRVEEDEDSHPIVVPLHDPLPPPPEVHYTRPTIGQVSPAPSLFSAAASPRDSQPNDESGSRNALKLGSGLAAGTTFTASIVAGFLLGQWVDHHWNHAGGTPWGTLVCSLVGIAAGFLNLFRVISATDRSRKR